MSQKDPAPDIAPDTAPDTQQPVVGQDDVSHVLLKCDSAALPGGQAFCETLSRALQAKGLNVTPYTGQAAHSLEADHVILETINLQRTPLGVSLGLAWTYGATGQQGQSETSSLRVMDRAMSVDMYERFVASLMRPDILPF
jgi:hypothetical protein